MALSEPAFVEVGQVAPRALAGARVELHWAAQCLAAAGDAFLIRAADDSHSNALWSHTLGALVGRSLARGVRAALHLGDLELLVLNSGDDVLERFELQDRTLYDALTWLGGTLSEATGESPRHALATRDYEMPDHAVAKGGAFSMDHAPVLHELARWYGNADMLLREVAATDSRASDIRCWPHHFDIGGIIMLDPDKPFSEARQIGFGLSPGDGSYPEPYFYVTPFPVPEGTDFPAVESGGHWHVEGFTGAILTGTVAAKGAGATVQSRSVAAFLASAIRASHQIIPG